MSLVLTDALINKLGGLNRFAVRPFSSVQKYARLGDYDQAFALLKKSHQRYEYAILNIKVSPRVDNLRVNSRYKEILRKMNLQ